MKSLFKVAISIIITVVGMNVHANAASFKTNIAYCTKNYAGANHTCYVIYPHGFGEYLAQFNSDRGGNTQWVLVDYTSVHLDRSAEDKILRAKSATYYFVKQTGNKILIKMNSHVNGFEKRCVMGSEVCLLGGQYEIVPLNKIPTLQSEVRALN